MLQQIIVYLIGAVVLVYIIRYSIRLFRHDSGSCSCNGCSGCELSEHCSTRPDKSTGKPNMQKNKRGRNHSHR